MSWFNMKRFFATWSKTELAWFLFCIASICLISVSLGDSILSFVAAVTGVLFTILAGKGQKVCYYFGMINAPLYAYLSYRESYYGDMALNVFYFVMMFVGLYSWGKNQSKDESKGIKRERLSRGETFLWGIVVVFATVCLWGVLKFAGGSQPLCDSLTNVLSVTAMLLTVRRAIEQWVLWIVVNAVEVFMWCRVWFESGNNISILLMWLLFLLNGIYLFRLWLKIGVEKDSSVCK
jgi:nicotinamide mononucleotide transporter